MEEKDIAMAVELLKAINEKIEEEEEKAEDLQEDEPDAENKCKAKNEEIDKRAEMGDIGGFLKSKGLSDEDIRYVYKHMEKLSYDKSSADKADNKKDEKAKNSMEDTIKEFYSEVKSNSSNFISESKAREIGKQRY